MTSTTQTLRLDLSICLIFVLILHLSSKGIYAVNQVFGKYGSVKVDIGSSFMKSFDQRWVSSWPDGIKLANNIQSSFPKAMAFHNVTGYPYAATQAKSRQIFRHPRTFSWNTDEELVITCKLSEISTNPACTRIAPPVNWLTVNDAKVTAESSPHDSEAVQIEVSKLQVENNLMHLRNLGMSREDIFRMLDKGPWILAFDFSNALNKLTQDLKLCLGISQDECKHIVSHCPFLLAQYSRYKGRDVCATVSVLNEISYSGNEPLWYDIMRFPTILATPPERLRGWMTLLHQYGIAKDIRLFGKMLRRAPFMFYRDAPFPFETEPTISSHNSVVVLHNAMRVLEFLQSYNLPLDAIIRSHPMILSTDVEEVRLRVNFFMNMFSDASRNTGSVDFKKTVGDFQQTKIVEEDKLSPIDLFGQSPSWMSVPFYSESSAVEYRADSLKSFQDLLNTYPLALSIDHMQLRRIMSSLRTSLKTSEAIFMVKSCPSILQKSPEILQSLLLFFMTHCGFRRGEVVSILSKYPSLLNIDIDTLKPKVDYLYQSLGFTFSMLRKYPMILTYDLHAHIRPRAEFLLAFNRSPVTLGLHFLAKASDKDFAETAEVKIDDYKRFYQSFVSIRKQDTVNSQRFVSKIYNNVD